MIFCSLILTILIGIIIFFEVKRQILSHRYKHIPSYEELPLIGSRCVLRKNAITAYKILFTELFFAKINKIFLGPRLLFFISDPDVLQAIMSGSNFTEKPFFYKSFRSKYGLVSAQHEIWKPIRKAVNPAFSQRMSLSFISIFEKHYEGLCEEIEGFDGQTFDIYKNLVKFGIRIILETNFGYSDPNNRVDPEIFEKYLANVYLRAINPYLSPNFVYNRTSLAKEDRKIDESFKKLFREVLLRRDTTDRSLFIDEMLKYVEENGFTNDDPLIQNMAIVFMAGYDTTATTMAMTILLLALHPEVDEKVAKELFEHYKPGDEIDQELIRKLIYLDKVVKESMRLFPSIPTVMKQNIKSTNIDKIGHLDKGSNIFISIYNLHRWKDIWGENADKFDPDEHFSDENVAKRHPYAYLPFTGGSRICIGYQYAMINMKVGLIKLLSQFKFTTKLKMEEFYFKLCVAMKLLNGHLVQAHPRKIV